MFVNPITHIGKRDRWVKEIGKRDINKIGPQPILVSDGIATNLTRIEIHGILLESILSPVVFLSSILVSIIYLPIAYYFWIVLIPAKLILRKRHQ